MLIRAYGNLPRGASWITGGNPISVLIGAHVQISTLISHAFRRSTRSQPLFHNPQSHTQIGTSMSEITRVEDPPVLRFGKHAGKSAAEVMATDPNYVQWVLAQPWFQEKNPQLVQFFMTGGGTEASETPEHNALQSKFTQDAYCLAVAAMFSAGQRLRTASEARREALVTTEPALASYVKSWHPRISARSFEKDSWDVQFTFSGAFSVIDISHEPECSCTPLLPQEDHDEPKTLQMRESHSRMRRINERRAKSRYTPHSYSSYRSPTFDQYVVDTEHEKGCLRSLPTYFNAWCLRDDGFIDAKEVHFGLELKPSMGDDFPAVLRQVHRYRSRSNGIHAAVVAGEFESAAVPWNIVKKQFWESGALLVREAELDALVVKHAAEWGARVDDPEVDFTINFKNQL